jgi:uncharacterized protein YndB with AHSA1/START domain
MIPTPAIPPPDLASRPLQMTVERAMASPPGVLFRAWTEQLDRWLAAPGTVLMTPEADTAFYFETHHDRERHPYYGRILRLEPDRRVELTWLSTGTRHAETVVTVEFIPDGNGTRLRLTQAGFPDQELRDAHEQGWPQALKALDQAFAGPDAPCHKGQETSAHDHGN